MQKGSWKTSLTFSLRQFKNNTRRSISVTFTAMGKATNITSKAHYAIFWKGRLLDGNASSFFFFFKTTACSDQFFHSAAFSYQSSLIANMERLNQFSSSKKKGRKKKRRDSLRWVKCSSCTKVTMARKEIDSAAQSICCSLIHSEETHRLLST